MAIYSINPQTNSINIVTLTCLKFTDSVSLIKIFSILRATYNFSATAKTIDFDWSHIKALKQCTLFRQKRYIICCLFLFAQAIYKN